MFTVDVWLAVTVNVEPGGAGLYVTPPAVTEPATIEYEPVGMSGNSIV